MMKLEMKCKLKTQPHVNKKGDKKYDACLNKCVLDGPL